MQIPFKLHVIVGPTDTDSIAKVVNAKAADIGAEMVVVAKHSKGRLKVSEGRVCGAWTGGSLDFPGGG